MAMAKRGITFVGLKLAIASATAEVLGKPLPRVRVMFNVVDGVPTVPLAGDDESGTSRSIGVDAIVGSTGKECAKMNCGSRCWEYLARSGSLEFSTVDGRSAFLATYVQIRNCGGP